MADHSIYQTPLTGRYTSKEMQSVFSDDYKFKTWHDCWIALAEGEKELGIEAVTQEMIDELKANRDVINYDDAAKKEKELRHDVMAHIYAYGLSCPKAKPIIHLGATSQYVGCNTDLKQMREGTKIIKVKLVNTIYNMSSIADKYKDLACLGYTHFQSAQPTTIGKRFTLYIQDLLMDLDRIESLDFKARSIQGTTGTLESFSKLFKGDYEKVKKLQKIVAQKLGFDNVFDVTGQTYPRKFDIGVAEALAGIGESLYKFAVDIRLLSSMKCVDEPFEATQIGSSAMAYKRNPMRSERICSLSRDLMGMPKTFYDTAATQWFERTLDDSAIRRKNIPETFLLAEAVLILANNITNQSVDLKKTRPLTFYKNRLDRLLLEELPFSATEEILMNLVENKGQDRQQMHEIIRKHSVATGIAIKEDGKDNDLFERLANDSKFPFSKKELFSYVKNPINYTGFALEQTQEYLKNVVNPRLDRYKDILGKVDSDIKV